MTLKFRLEVYSGIVKGLLMSQDRYGLELFITRSNAFGKNKEQMVKEKEINSEWLDFIVWYNQREWWFFRKKMVFRGLRDYSLGDLKRILKNGNDRIYNPNTKQSNMMNYCMKKNLNLNPEDFLFAGDLRDAWIVANGSLGLNNGKRVILIYDERLLKNLGGDGYAYALKNGVPSFKEALIAVVIINYC